VGPYVSEVELASEPEQVGATAEDALRINENRRAIRRVLPVDVELDPAVGVPVDAKVDHADVVGPELAVGEAILEYDIPQVELAIANERPDRARTPFAAERPKRPQGHDGRPTLDFLAGNEVAQHGVEPAHGDLRPFLQAGPSHLELADVPLRL